MNRDDAYTALVSIRATLDTAAGQITDLVTAAKSPADDNETPRAVLDAVNMVDGHAAALDELIDACHDAESRTFRDGL